MGFIQLILALIVANWALSHTTLILVVVISLVALLVAGAISTGASPKFSGEWPRSSVARFATAPQRPTPENIGAEGERRVAARLAELGMTVLSDSIVHGHRGLTQIDHIVLTASCIFVIETKNYSGTIYGDPDDAEWTIAYERGDVSVYNPIYQNNNHLAAIQHIVADQSVELRSLVALVGDGDTCDAIWDAEPIVDLDQLGMEVSFADRDTRGPSDAILAAWMRIEAAARHGEPFRAQHKAEVKAAWG